MSVEIRYEPLTDQWEITEIGLTRGFRNTKAEAVAEGRRIARDRDARLIIRKKNGTITESRDFGPTNGW